MSMGSRDAVEAAGFWELDLELELEERKMVGCRENSVIGSLRLTRSVPRQIFHEVWNVNMNAWLGSES